jgi:integral membrane sensor domain MASE1
MGATIATGSTLQACAASYLIDHVISKNNPLDKGWDIIRFFIIVCCACLIAASMGIGSMVLVGITPLADAGFSWVTWWLGDCVGIVLVTPLLLVWFTPRQRTGFAWLEASAMLLVIAAVAFMAFTGKASNNALAASLAFLAAPLIVIATFRFGQRGATASLLVFAGVAVLGTASGFGPFVYNSTNESLLSLQAFVGILSLTALSLSAVLEERRNEEALKANAIDELQRVLTEVSTLRSMIPLCAWCRKVRNDAGSWEQLEGFMHRSYAASFTDGICPDCESRQESLDGRECLDES